MTDLSSSFHPYSREDQLRRGPSRKQGKAEKDAAYSGAIEHARDPQSGYVICAICNRPCKEGDYALDHIEPRGRGGKTSQDNLQPVHPACHSDEHAKGKRKAAKDPVRPVTRKKS